MSSHDEVPIRAAARAVASRESQEMLAAKLQFGAHFLAKSVRLSIAAMKCINPAGVREFAAATRDEMFRYRISEEKAEEIVNGIEMGAASLRDAATALEGVLRRPELAGWVAEALCISASRILNRVCDVHDAAAGQIVEHRAEQLQPEQPQPVEQPQPAVQALLFPDSCWRFLEYSKSLAQQDTLHYCAQDAQYECQNADLYDWASLRGTMPPKTMIIVSGTLPDTVYDQIKQLVGE